MNKIFKVLGKRGRITIPYEIRIRQGFTYNDILSFEETDNKTVIIKREKICDGCKKIDDKPEENKTDNTPLHNYLDELSLDEQREALVHLTLKWVENKNISQMEKQEKI